MSYKEHKPPGRLAPFIRCFWELEHDYSMEPMKGGERLWPDGYYEMIFSYGKPYKQLKADGSEAFLPHCFLIGLYDHELLLDSSGRTGLLGIRFYAWGLYPLLQTHMSKFNNKITSTDLLFGSDLPALDFSPEGREKSMEQLIDYMMSRFQTGDEKKNAVSRLGFCIQEQKGIVNMTELMKSFEETPRKLQKLFLEETGISAKHYAKIVRFREAKRSIERNPDINIAELAYTSGYSDQPHFIRNFRELFGITPTQHKQRIKEMMKFFQKGNS